MSKYCALLFSVLTLLCTTSAAFAKEKSKNKRKSEVEEPRANRRILSEEHRKSISFGAYAEIGLVNILAFSRGIRGAAAIDADQQVEISYINSEFSIFGFSTVHDVIAVRYKRFLGNSFNVFSGLGMRSLTSTEPYSTGDDVLESTAITAELGLGNHWSFGGFSLGCDWIAGGFPVAVTSNSESFGSNKTDIEKKDDRKNFSKQTEQTDLMAVRFFLGAQF